MEISKMRPDMVRSFVARNITLPPEMSSGDDPWAYFLNNKSAQGGKMREKEAYWLSSNGGSGVRLEELWRSYLASKGFSGDEDGFRSFLLTGTA